MAGERELVAFIPPILLAEAAISQYSGGGGATVTLSDARIEGSADPTYGTIGWAPPTDGGPFCLLTSGATKESQYETGRVRSVTALRLFIAIDVALVPAPGLSLNDQAVAWRDALRLLIPRHRRLSPQADNAWPTAGDVRWEMTGSAIKEREDILGIAYYGVEIQTALSWTTLVAFQG